MSSPDRGARGGDDDVARDRDLRQVRGGREWDHDLTRMSGEGAEPGAQGRVGADGEDLEGLA